MEVASPPPLPTTKNLEDDAQLPKGGGGIRACAHQKRPLQNFQPRLQKYIYMHTYIYVDLYVLWVGGLEGEGVDFLCTLHRVELV